MFTFPAFFLPIPLFLSPQILLILSLYSTSLFYLFYLYILTYSASLSSLIYLHPNILLSCIFLRIPLFLLASNLTYSTSLFCLMYLYIFTYSTSLSSSVYLPPIFPFHVLSYTYSIIFTFLKSQSTITPLLTCCHTFTHLSFRLLLLFSLPFLFLCIYYAFPFNILPICT